MGIVVLEILWRFPLRREGKKRERSKTLGNCSFTISVKISIKKTWEKEKREREREREE